MDIKEILERIALPARSNKKGFYETDKLEAIEALLAENNSEFHIVQKTPHTWIFGRNEISPGEDCMLISTHADIVEGIKHPFSELNEETHYFKGTYDNLGTNAAAVYLMLEKDVPDGVYFAFNDDEETGRCHGASDALKYVRNASGREPVVFALDVTDEGYDNNRLFTVEGFHAGNDAVRRMFLTKMLETEGSEQSFEVVKLKKKDDVSVLPEGYVSDELTVFDESVFYAENGCLSCSICLPGEGSMHSDSGFYVKEAVMKGYAESLAQIVCKFKGFNDRADEFKEAKDSFVAEAKGTPFRKKESYYWAYSGGSKNISSDYYTPSDLTDDEYREMVEYNRSFGIYDDVNGEDYAYFVDRVMDECWELATGYNEDEFEIFCSDMIDMYGVEDTEDVEHMLANVFCDVQYSCCDEDGEWDDELQDKHDEALEDIHVGIAMKFAEKNEDLDI